MNKAEFIEVLATHFNGDKSAAAHALNAVTQTITYQTVAGEKVTLTGFGSFEKVHRAARQVRNPRTGQRQRVKATAVPRFRAGTDLKAYVSGAKKVPKAAKKAAKRTAATTVTPTKAAATKTPLKAAPQAAPTARRAPAKVPTAKTAAARTAAVNEAVKKTIAARTAVAKKVQAPAAAADLTEAKSRGRRSTPSKGS